MNKIIEALKVIKEEAERLEQEGIFIFSAEFTYKREMEVFVSSPNIDSLAKEYGVDVTTCGFGDEYNKREIVVDGVKIFDLVKREDKQDDTGH